MKDEKEIKEKMRTINDKLTEIINDIHYKVKVIAEGNNNLMMNTLDHLALNILSTTYFSARDKEKWMENLTKNLNYLIKIKEESKNEHKQHR